MQTVDNQVQLQSQEDIIAEKILKRAEIARITRQLKSKLFKAGLKVRESQGKIPPSSPNSSSPKPDDDSTVISNKISATAMANVNKSMSGATTPMKRKSTNFDDMRPISMTANNLDDIDDSFSSPAKRLHHSNIPSSPFYSTNNTSPVSYNLVSSSQPPSAQKQQDHKQQQQQHPPSTPPSSHRFANLDEAALNKTPSPQKDDPSLSHGSAKHALQSALFSTPKTNCKVKKSLDFKTPNSKYVNENEEGADLLLYMSNSPARPVTLTKDTKDINAFLNIPTTPKSSSASMLQLSSTPNLGLEATPPRSNMLPGLPLSTPSIMINSHPMESRNSGPEQNVNSNPLQSQLQQQQQQQPPTTPISSSSHAMLQGLSNTPTLSVHHHNVHSAQNNNNSDNKFQTPGTPNNNNILIHGNQKQLIGTSAKLSSSNIAAAMMTNGNKTPAFSMSDYVNIFTPSPRHTRTPEFSSHSFVKPSILSYSKELNGVMNNSKLEE